MRNIYSCIDIGSYSIKLVVMEKINNKFVVLSRVKLKTKGLQKGLIVNEEEVLISVKEAFCKIEKDLSINLSEILCIVPCNMAEFVMVSGITHINGKISKEEISEVLQSISLPNQDSDKVLVNLVPVFYQVDDGDNLKEVEGLSGNKLTVKAIATILPKLYIRSIFNIFKQLGIKIVDVGLGLQGDYFAMRSNELDQTTIAIVNIGYEKCEVGVFNKGIMIKADKMDIGSRDIDKDIAHTFNLERKKARYLKETFACSNTRYADVNDVVSISNRDGKTITINQLKISEVVEAGLTEILKFAKKQINILTNREIRYIIVTGGISEIAGCEYVLENVFGRCASVLNINKMGVRSNSFSSCIGFIEYFSHKLQLSGKAYSMINDIQLDIFAKNKKKTAGEMAFGSFIKNLTGNKED